MTSVKACMHINSTDSKSEDYIAGFIGKGIILANLRIFQKFQIK